MKANELMIGDWVYTENDTTPRQIDWIRSGEVGLFWNKIVTPQYLKPIPLTPEILEKNGVFKNPLMGEQRHFIYNLDGFELLAIYDADFSFLINKGARKIKYVHELQHALKLCGIEKQIEL